MEISTSQHAGNLVIHIHANRLDAASAMTFKQAVEAALPDKGAGIILDLAEVSFMDSSGLGAVVAVHKGLHGGQIKVVGLQQAVQELFRLTRMDRIFQCHGSVNEAIKA
ncbi:STAS domain-containing protein [Ferrimonas pelagia]|uniref:Anti-sigma factor antagonist n=1 Tax=Ferrimonas pelagia TaxID=1177826 RepID=A0ABP9FID4_9GAMM